MSDSEIFSVTSFTLSVRHVRWLQANVSNRSALMRELLDEHIVHAEGYEGQLEELARKKAELEVALAGVETQIEELGALQEEFERRVEGERETRMQRLERELGRR